MHNVGMIPMRTLGRTGLQVSALGLGTTEIGYTYGIGPRNMPTEQEAIDLLNHAVELGMTFIDTGHFYGAAQERIGKSGIAKREGVIISTKCGHVLDRGEAITNDELIRQFRIELEESLQALGMESAPLVQIHGGSAEQIRSGVISHAMNQLKQEGKLQHFGISTRGEEAPIAAIEDGNFETLQLAHSILDQRMAQQIFKEAAAHGIGIINRSVLLKGALTPARAHLAPSLVELKANADKAEAIAKELGTDLPSLAIRFALSNPAVSTILVGSNKIKNLESAAKAVGEGPLPEDILSTLRALAMEDPMQVDPKNWDIDFVADAKGGKKVHAHTK